MIGPIEHVKNMRNPPSCGLIPLLIVVAITSGCGNKEETAEKAKAATQVAAKVNAEEITVHQVNNILARTPNVKPEAAVDAKREILNRLIDQELARQEAIQNKLDRSPNVMQAIQAARSEILARAYLERIASAQTKPSAAEIKQYYTEYPELFAQRRIFSIEEILVQQKAGLTAGLREQVAKARSLQDVAGWLKSQDVKFTANRGVRGAEQIPREILPKLQEKKDGSIQMFGAGDGPFQVIRVVASKPAPVDEATATPPIQQFLFNRRSSEEVAKEMKRLKDKAAIAYVGEFADGVASAEAKAKAEAAAKAKAEARETPSQPAQLPQETIDKGVRGLR